MPDRVNVHSGHLSIATAMASDVLGQRDSWAPTAALGGQITRMFPVLSVVAGRG